MFTLHYTLKKTHSKNGKSYYSIFAVFYFKRRQFAISVKQNIDKKHWVAEDEKVKRTYANYRLLNDFLVRFKQDTEAKILDMLTKEVNLDFETFRINVKRLIGKGQTEYRLLDAYNKFMELHIKHQTKATVKKYRTIQRHLEAFLQSKHGNRKYGSKVSIEAVNQLFFDHFTSYLFEKEFTNSYAKKVLQMFKSFLSWSYEREITTSNKYYNIKLPKGSASFQIALTPEDLKAIENLNMLPERLEKVRDLFFFQLHTAQRFSDVQNLKANDIVNNRWNLRQQKTNTHLEIPLSFKAMEILEKYNYNLPSISNQKMNAYLKELGKLAELTEEITITKKVSNQTLSSTKQKYELITTHTARRTFVSLASYKGVSQSVVKSFTGHLTDNMIDIYFKSNNKESSKVIDSIFNN